MSKLISIEELKKSNLDKLGLTCGLEIHQQLNTGKLFCNCPCELVSNETLNKQIQRRLRFSIGESGEVDKAAISEFKKGKHNIYKFNNKIACLVDLDEQPPKGPNEKALNTVLGVSKVFNLKFFDRIQFMRKLIIDGSITTGFQRTALIGVGGNFKTKDGIVKINGINLEEDSCRTIERNSDHTVFSIDRQGIPLIEITTGPQIHTPEQALEAAKIIGDILRSFKETKRGLGTIRQDLNVSIKGAHRVEIKGAQNLELIPQIIEDEMIRQKIHLSIIEEVESRKINCENFTDWEITDVTKIFEKCDSKVIKDHIKDKDSKVLAVKLFNFKGILGHEMQIGHRFASEVSDRNKKHFPQVKGLFHSDELPKYGIEEKQVNEIRKKLNLKENDSFILIANKKDIAEKSIENILLIVQELLEEAPEHVRQVDPKGTLTNFLRPMPGSARMYPETDIEDIVIDKKIIERIEIPELFSKRLERVSKDFQIESSKTIEILNTYSEEEVKELMKISDKSASAIYSIIFDIPKDIRKRDNIEPTNIKYNLLKDLLQQAKENDFNQKVIRDIFVSLYKDNLEEVSNLKKYIEEKGLIADKVDDREIEKIIKNIIEKNKGAPFGALMGIAMQQTKGAIDGKTISQILKKLM